jgi:hypothetical protein
VGEIEEARADLAVIRERMSALPEQFPRELKSRLWTAWQDTNRVVWQRLTELWRANEQQLAGRLDEAERLLDGGQVRPARDVIKAFQTARSELPVSHQVARALRARANALWQRSREVGRARHEQYLAGLARRLEHWRYLQRRAERELAALQVEIAMRERDMASATTDVGHALAAGRLHEAQRAQEQQERERRALAAQIAEAESRLGQEAVTPESTS